MHGHGDRGAGLEHAALSTVGGGLVVVTAAPVVEVVDHDVVVVGPTEW
ncbi:MAG: hypothetical protein ABSE98_00915 [Acidimicrobiales bacterium]